jgi:hydrogenase/urease accessory protein HupE
VRENRLRIVKALFVAVALAGSMVMLEAAQLPVVDPCDYIENSFLRWLAGCPPLDSGAN